MKLDVRRCCCCRGGSGGDGDGAFFLFRSLCNDDFFVFCSNQSCLIYVLGFQTFSSWVYVECGVGNCLMLCIVSSSFVMCHLSWLSPEPDILYSFSSRSLDCF